MRSAGYHEKMIGRTYLGGDQVTELNLVLYNTIKWPYQPKHSPSYMLRFSTTRFRWVQQDPSSAELPDWAIDDVFIGEACPQQCHGRGDCVHGKCVCDPTYVGELHG